MKNQSRQQRFQFSTIGLLVGALIAQIGCGIESDGLPDGNHLAESQQPAYYLSSAVWSNRAIAVCWENPQTTNDQERGWVRQAVAESWPARANLDFIGWGACAANSSGIRIQIADTGPHTRGLGNRLDGVVNGMVLNFTFQNWSPACQNQRQFCIRAIAVHEFGHALAFAHEQNRPDTPSTCTEPAQGTNGDVTVGTWDLNSVMNYCNPSWNGNGQLSATDVRAVQQVYGARQSVSGNAWADFNGDGRADYCQLFGSDNGFGSRVRCTVSTGAGFGATRTSGVVDWGFEAGRAWVDFNADGRADYCRSVGSANNVSSYLQCTASTGAGFATTYTSGVVDWGFASGRAWADFNGDGRADYCRLVGSANNVSSYLQCTVSTGAGFGATYSSGVVDWGYDTGRSWVDFSGDRQADFCRVVGDNGSLREQCTLATGTGFGLSYNSPVLF